MARKELEFSTRLTREDAAGIIEALVEGLKEGLLKVQKSNEILELEVPRVIDLEIEAKPELPLSACATLSIHNFALLSAAGS